MESSISNTETRRGEKIVTTAVRLQYTSVRTRVLNGQVVVGLKHTVRDSTGDTSSKTPWIEMTPEDAATLVKSLQESLAGL